MNVYTTLTQTDRLRVSDGATMPILTGCESSHRLPIAICPQLGDFDSLEYAWWLNRELPQLTAAGVTIRMVGIGNLAAGQKFCDFTGFPTAWLFVDERAELHAQLELYPGLSLRVPGCSTAQNAWLNPILMCAGIGSSGYLTQRGGTFLFDDRGVLRYEHRDRGILGFAANMSQPLSFISR